MAWWRSAEVWQLGILSACSRFGRERLGATVWAQPIGREFFGREPKGRRSYWARAFGRDRLGAVDWARPFERDFLGATRMGAKLIRREHLDARVWARPFGRDRLGTVPFGRRVN